MKVVHRTVAVYRRYAEKMKVYLKINCVNDLFFLFLLLNQANQLGVYRAFVDNYEQAVETAEKCCQANSQFAEISEVRKKTRERDKKGTVTVLLSVLKLLRELRSVSQDHFTTM